MAIPDHSWLHQKDELEAFAKTFDKSSKLRQKKSCLWNIGFLKRAATTIGATVYIPDDWTVASVRHVIPHECGGHVKQFRYCGLGIHPNAGIFPGMIIVYLLIFFPIFLAWGRYRMELHADTKSWEFHLKEGLMSPPEVMSRIKRFVPLVAGSAYLYSWPKPWAMWGFKRRAKKVIKAAGF